MFSLELSDFNILGVDLVRLSLSMAIIFLVYLYWYSSTVEDAAVAALMLGGSYILVCVVLEQIHLYPFLEVLKEGIGEDVLTGLVFCLVRNLYNGTLYNTSFEQAFEVSAIGAGASWLGDRLDDMLDSVEVNEKKVEEKKDKKKSKKDKKKKAKKSNAPPALSTPDSSGNQQLVDSIDNGGRGVEL